MTLPKDIAKLTPEQWHQMTNTTGATPLEIRNAVKELSLFMLYHDIDEITLTRKRADGDRRVDAKVIATREEQ